jgi:hypothetical protein
LALNQECFGISVKKLLPTLDCVFINGVGLKSEIQEI